MENINEKDLCIILEDNFCFMGGIVFFNESDYGGTMTGLTAKLRYDAWEGKLFLVAMQHILEFLFVYNIGLCKHKDEVPKEIFALRFFEKFSTIEPTANRLIPKKSKRTEEILESLSDAYDVEGNYHNYSMIFVDEETRKEVWNKTKHRICINISDGHIDTWGFIKILHQYEYETIKGKPPKGLPISDIYDSNIRINQIADYIEEVKNSPDGFATDLDAFDNLTLLR